MAFEELRGGGVRRNHEVLDQLRGAATLKSGEVL